MRSRRRKRNTEGGLKKEREITYLNLMLNQKEDFTKKETNKLKMKI